MQMQWKILQPDHLLVREIQAHLNCHAITATILANRHIGSAGEAARFIQPALDGLPAPTALLGMSAAVERILRAMQDKEKILVFGDYDADGVTATAVLYNFLIAAGAQVSYHLPHRVREGYGLLPMHINQLAVPQRASLIITVDCGSSSFDAVAAAKRFSIDVIVTDHHNIDGDLPDAHAIINPKIKGQPADFAELAGVGVAFYLIIALRAALRAQGWWYHRPEPNLKTYSDLVAIGTVADMVSLKGVNRILTRLGLEQINTTPKPGIRALIAASGIHGNTINAEDISFRLGPRINAAGRMAHAQIAFDLLNASSLDQAQNLAEELNVLNHRRQETENEIFQQIVATLENHPNLLARKTLLLAGTDWHEGVLGIVAAKLVARYHRPAVVISARDGKAKGSGRSIPQVNLYDALAQCHHLLDKFGGHRMAAGLSVATENIDLLRAAFESAVAAMLATEQASPPLEIDCEIDLDQITPQLMDELETLSPYGTDNPQPLFMARDLRVAKAYIVGRRHRRMQLCQPHQSAKPITAMQFNINADTPLAGSFERMAFRLQWNRYRAEKEMQMVVEEW